MYSPGTIRKVIQATARRLECSEHSVFIAWAKTIIADEQNALLVGDGSYALYCEDSLDDDSIIDSFCLEILTNGVVKVKFLEHITQTS